MPEAPAAKPWCPLEESWFPPGPAVGGTASLHLGKEAVPRARPRGGAWRAGSGDWNAERHGAAGSGLGRRRVQVAAGAGGVHSCPPSGEGLAALPAAVSPASRPRNYLKRRQFDSRAPLGWVLLFLCFNDSSQPLGMSCAINSLALLKAAGMKFLLHHSFGDNCL